jgi:hypothetical protein
MRVDDEEVIISEWLESKKEEWFPEWSKWSQAVALSSEGYFHWTSDSFDIVYYHKNRYLTFVEWKKECYIGFSYQYLEETEVFKFLKYLWQEKKIPLALVHPMAWKHEASSPLTKEKLIELFKDPYIMCCQPYVVAAKLMDIPLDWEDKSKYDYYKRKTRKDFD